MRRLPPNVGEGRACTARDVLVSRDYIWSCLPSVNRRFPERERGPTLLAVCGLAAVHLDGGRTRPGHPPVPSPAGGGEAGADDLGAARARDPDDTGLEAAVQVPATSVLGDERDERREHCRHGYHRTRAPGRWAGCHLRYRARLSRPHHGAWGGGYAKEIMSPVEPTGSAWPTRVLPAVPMRARVLDAERGAARAMVLARLPALGRAADGIASCATGCSEAWARRSARAGRTRCRRRRASTVQIGR